MSIIGLTGDVGAGKSTLCSVWREMGARVIDADTVARSMWDRADVRAEAEKRWGAGFFDEPDHKTLWAKIAAKIFNDAEEYKFASALIHRRTGEELKKLARESGGWTIVEIPLLYEGGHDEWLDYVVYASAPFDKRVARNAKRNWNAGEVARREAKLLPGGEKIAKADFVLTNDGTEEEWKQKARELGEKLKRLSPGNGTGVRKFPKALEIAAESAGFLLVQYLIARFMLSTRASVVYVITFAANVFVFIKYGETLARLTDSRATRAAVFAAYLAALAACVYFFGYFPAPPESAALRF